MSTKEDPLVRFTDMAYGGDAVGRADDGLAVFAWPGIVGEQGRVRVTARRANLLRGVVTEVVEPSPLRVRRSSRTASATPSSSVVSAPPSPAATFFVA